jgi:hypothetical protein
MSCAEATEKVTNEPMRKTNGECALSFINRMMFHTSNRSTYDDCLRTGRTVLEDTLRST